MGGLYDRDSVRRAAEGTRAVFSVQMPDMNDLEGDSELVHATNLLRATRDADVPQFVHTSVSGAGALLGVELTAPSLSLAEAVAQGMPEWGVAHEWQNQVGSPARPEYARALGLPTTDFRTWAAQNM
ncbi:hypothetical protein [Streptomyces sp. NPDC059479]|uniref:hypothetical protein n=1 Tax=Streptomyces sp. NPDC059479 TaxID=3346848 RepID=UPI0036B8A54C